VGRTVCIFLWPRYDGILVIGYDHHSHTEIRIGAQGKLADRKGTGPSVSSADADKFTKDCEAAAKQTATKTGSTTAISTTTTNGRTYLACITLQGTSLGVSQQTSSKGVFAGASGLGRFRVALTPTIT